jgi:hypothetical protein
MHNDTIFDDANRNARDREFLHRRSDKRIDLVRRELRL